MSGWVCDAYADQLGVRLEIPDPDARICAAAFRPSESDTKWYCTREPRHPGRHMATKVPLDMSTGEVALIGSGSTVQAAWPGDHEPTAADLETVPS